MNFPKIIMKYQKIIMKFPIFFMNSKQGKPDDYISTHIKIKKFIKTTN
jgi:hypothetical protein